MLVFASVCIQLRCVVTLGGWVRKNFSETSEGAFRCCLLPVKWVPDMKTCNILPLPSSSTNVSPFPLCSHTGSLTIKIPEGNCRVTQDGNIPEQPQFWTVSSVVHQ